MMLPIFLGMVALLLSPPASALLSSSLSPLSPAPECKPPAKELTPEEQLKKDAGYKAVDDYVESKMVVGLGTGSTAYYAVERVGIKLCKKELTDIVAIPTSERTMEQAANLKIPLATLDTKPVVDVAIDGADTVDPQLNLVKGGGGAHFREKIVEVASKVFVVIVDDSKLKSGLGKDFPVPVEIVPFCHEYTKNQIEQLSAIKGKCVGRFRTGSAANNKAVEGEPLAKTDNGNYIVDLVCQENIADPVAAAKQLRETIGVVEHGLFTGMTTAVIIAAKNGVQKVEATNKGGKKTWDDWTQKEEVPQATRSSRPTIRALK